MKRAIAITLITATVQFGGAYGLKKAYSADCDVTCQADAAWEGLSTAQQHEVVSTGEQGMYLDELVINFREALMATPSDYETHLELTSNNEWQIYSVPIRSCMEDMPCWNCKTMGNLQCGPTKINELPRTE